MLLSNPNPACKILTPKICTDCTAELVCDSLESREADRVILSEERKSWKEAKNITHNSTVAKLQTTIAAHLTPATSLWLRTLTNIIAAQYNHALIISYPSYSVGHIWSLRAQRQSLHKKHECQQWSSYDSQSSHYPHRRQHWSNTCTTRVRKREARAHIGKTVQRIRCNTLWCTLDRQQEPQGKIFMSTNHDQALRLFGRSLQHKRTLSSVKAINNTQLTYFNLLTPNL